MHYIETDPSFIISYSLEKTFEMQITVKICVDCISSITKFAIYKSALLLFCNCIMKENSAVYFREESYTFYEKLQCCCCFLILNSFSTHCVYIHTSLLFGIDKYTREWIAYLQTGKSNILLSGNKANKEHLSKEYNQS